MKERPLKILFSHGFSFGGRILMGGLQVSIPL